MKLTVDTVAKLLDRWSSRVANGPLAATLRRWDTARELEPLINELLDDPTDDTWTRIVLRAPHDVPVKGREWIYYRRPEHGGLTEDPLQAAQLTHLEGDGLYLMEDWARQHFGDRDWERARLIVDVRPFHQPDALDKIIDHHLRQAALKKLTEHERRALGLADG